jgi:hypothetical protein
MTSAFETRVGVVRPRRFTGCGLGLLLGWLAVAWNVGAQEVDAETRTLARELALQGAESFEREDYVAALDRLDRAAALYPAPSIGVMRARALARLGRLLEAMDRYEETQRMPLADDAPEAFRQAVSDAKNESAELRGRIPRLTVRVRTPVGLAGPIPKGLSVQLDGKPLPPVLLDIERPTDPGRHEVIAVAPGYHVTTREVTLAESERATLEIPLEVKADSAGGTDPNPSRTSSVHLDPDQPTGTAARPMAWVLLGVGAAGLATSAVAGLIALDKKSSLDSVCRPGCPSGSQGDIDAFRSSRTVSYVGLAIGVFGVGTGGYLLLSGSEEAAHVAVNLGLASAGFSGAF